MIWPIQFFTLILLSKLHQSFCFSQLDPSLVNSTADLHSKCSLNLIKAHFTGGLTIVSLYNIETATNEMLDEQSIIVNELYLAAETTIQMRRDYTDFDHNVSVAISVSASVYREF